MWANQPTAGFGRIRMFVLRTDPGKFPGPESSRARIMNMHIRKTRLCSLIALAGIAVMPSAYAAGGITLGLDYGQAEARKFCEHITNCDSSDDSAKAEIGLQLNSNFGLELGYTSLGTLLDAKDNQFMASQDSSAMTLSALGLIAFTDRFGIYGRLGAAQYNTDSAGTVAGVPVKDQDGTTPVYGAGVKLGLTDNFSLRAEYQVYSNISRVDGKKDNVQGLYAGVVFLL